MSVGFSSRNLKYSLSDLGRILLIPDAGDLCRRHGLACSDGGVKFVRGSFSDDVKVCRLSFLARLVTVRTFLFDL